MAQGIKLGFIRLSSDNKSKYKIDYRMDIPAVSEKLVKLKEEFASYIPKLAQFHSEKLTIFDELKPSAVDIFNQLWEGSYTSVWEEGSSVLKSTIRKEDLANALQVWVRNYQRPVEFSYISSQYYMPFGNIPESVSIFHKVKFENDEVAVFRISLQKETEGWHFMGMNFTPEKKKELT